MPEVIFFLFELARAYVADTNTTSWGQNLGVDAAEHAFVNEVVRPLYDVVFRETFAGLDEKNRPKPLQRLGSYPKNYDDWNDACWTHRSLSTLRTRAATVNAIPAKAPDPAIAIAASASGLPVTRMSKIAQPNVRSTQSFSARKIARERKVPSMKCERRMGVAARRLSCPRLRARTIE